MGWEESKKSQLIVFYRLDLGVKFLLKIVATKFVLENHKWGSNVLFRDQYAEAQGLLEENSNSNQQKAQEGSYEIAQGTTPPGLANSAVR